MDTTDFQCLPDEKDSSIVSTDNTDYFYTSKEVNTVIIPTADVYPLPNEATPIEISEEVDVEIIPVQDVYPLSDTYTVTNAQNNLKNTTGYEEIEVPRGALGVLSNEFFLPACSDVVLTESIEEETEECKKTRMFIEGIKIDGAWARSLSAVKIAIHLNPYLTKDVVSDLLTHCITRVNNRPKSLTLTSKSVTLEDIGGLIKLAFSINDEEMAINNSLVRLYCKNTTKRLNDLANVCSELDGVRVSCGDVFAELRQGGSGIRYRTSEISKYLTLEHLVPDTKMRVLTSFNIRKRDNKSREIIVSWFDEYKEGFGRVAYIHFDHIANCQIRNRVSFAETTCQEFTVDDDRTMYPVANLNHPVHDLIHFLSKLDPSPYKR